MSTTKDPKVTKDQTGNPRGRPKATKNPVGRPKGEASIMKEYRQRMLNSPKSRKVLQSIFDAALDDEHKNQSSAWKIIMDRIAPVSGFEKEAGGAQRSAITVNISSVGDMSLGPQGDTEATETLEGDFEHIDSQGDLGGT